MKGRSRGTGEPPPSNALYAVVGTGMRGYVRSAFRLRVIGRENARVQRGQLIVATHRSDSDVPVVGSLLFLEGGAWRGPARMYFASRDDLFERGALAGMAPGLPGPLARALWRVPPAGGLARVRVRPLGRGDLAAPAQALRAVDPATPLDRVLPAALVEELAQRAERRGHGAPATAADALNADFAGVLFAGAGPEVLDSPLLHDFWQARARDAAADLRRMVDLVRAGNPLVVFPEGRLSPDGSIGPLRRGFGVLARAARPTSVLPIALAYDDLCTGRRPHLVVAVGRTFVPTPREEEAEVLAAMRRLMPLTCGQVVARVVTEAGELPPTSALDDRVVHEMAAARREGRPIDPALKNEGRRRRLLEDARAALDGREESIARLAREYESARD
jgi:1-acyl-sn-glycerol-3-phosphate acyltransferase